MSTEIIKILDAICDKFGLGNRLDIAKCNALCRTIM